MGEEAGALTRVITARQQKTTTSHRERSGDDQEPDHLQVIVNLRNALKKLPEPGSRRQGSKGQCSHTLVHLRRAERATFGSFTPPCRKRIRYDTFASHTCGLCIPSAQFMLVAREMNGGAHAGRFGPSLRNPGT